MQAKRTATIPRLYTTCEVFEVTLMQNFAELWANLIPNGKLMFGLNFGYIENLWATCMSGKLQSCPPLEAKERFKCSAWPAKNQENTEAHSNHKFIGFTYTHLICPMYDFLRKSRNRKSRNVRRSNLENPKTCVAETAEILKRPSRKS